MSRNLGALASEVAKPVLNPFYAVSFALPTPIYVWSMVGTLLFGGNAYEGVGSFGTIGAIAESSDGSAVGMTVSLSGIEHSLADEVLNQPYRGVAMMIYLGAVAADFCTVTAPPALIWRGKIDTVTLTDGASLMITITGESRMRDQGRPRVRRYTNQEQQERYPGDRFFEFLPSLAEINMVWGKA